MTPRLELENVSRAFAGRAVVEAVSLRLSAGEVVCLLGPSGCGKSTTLRIAAGVDRQDAGRVLIDGEEVSSARFHAPPEARGVGLMFQDFALFPHLRVGENVGFGLRGRDPARVHDLLARVDLASYERAFPHQLSGGEQQRVALARALAPRPRVLLMDEPFSGLDDRLRDEVRDRTLALLRDEDSAVLMVTHEPAEALRMADRIALMRAGRVVQAAPPLQVYTTPVDREAAAFFSDVNVITARVADGSAQTPFGPFVAPGLADGQAVEVVIRPQHVRLDFDRQGRGPGATEAE
ncbi:MAG: ABC transporter ATP-binding protein, partial [Pseudomonadota bacterium]